MDFSAASLRRLPCDAKPYEVRDDKARGLILRIQPSGQRTFYFEHSRHKRVKLGVFPNVSVAMARAEMPRVLKRIQAGEDSKPEWLRPAVSTANGVTLKELADAYDIEFKALKRAQGFEPRSLEVLATVIRAIGAESAAGFDVRRWQLSLVKKRTAKTANRKLDALRSLYRWALAKGLIESNACDGVRRLKAGNVTRERVRIPDAAAEARLREHLTGYLLDCYTFARNTGLRLGELRRIRREDIDTAGVHVLQSKSGKSRIVPLNAAATDVLLTRPEKGLLFGSAIKRAWLKAQKDAAPYPFTWNESTRHAFISDLLRRGVAPFTVAKLAGHADLSMLNIYGHALHDDLAAAVAKI